MITKRYKLLVRAEMRGAIREPGYVFTLEDGQLGPQRTVVASDHGASISDVERKDGLKDVPLYVELVDQANKD